MAMMRISRNLSAGIPMLVILYATAFNNIAVKFNKKIGFLIMENLFFVAWSTIAVMIKCEKIFP